MKRRFLCALTALALAAAPAMAEGGLVSAVVSASPVRAEFEEDGLSLTLPAGLEVLRGEEFDAYEAAAWFDYPETARTILAAVDANRGAALVIAEAESDLDCLDAAREAAETLISDPEAATEETFGENRAAAFACAIGDQTYRLYYLSDGARLLIVGVSGVDQGAIDNMLTGLSF